MLYKTNQDLPLEIRTRLSEDAQELYRAAYNCAIHWYGETVKAHQVAASAVRMESAKHLSALAKGQDWAHSTEEITAGAN
jgi:cation transport regulator